MSKDLKICKDFKGWKMGEKWKRKMKKKTIKGIEEKPRKMVSYEAIKWKVFPKRRTERTFQILVKV